MLVSKSSRLHYGNLFVCYHIVEPTEPCILAEHLVCFPKVVTSIPTVVRHIYQLARFDIQGVPKNRVHVLGLIAE